MRAILLFLLLFSARCVSQIDALQRNASTRTMTQRWELDSTSTRGTFLITPYKPIYLLPFRYTTDVNRQPDTRNTDSTYVVPAPIDYNSVELKFQVSFKVKIFQDMLWRHADLWAAYTQVSHWQLYNSKLSRPFRETNYEPELILNFPLDFKLFGFNARMASVAFNHQSNGRSRPLSRSWNRIIFQFGLEKDHWSINLRPWIRLSDSEDDNPKISDYLGRADLNVVYANEGHVFSLIGSHNLSFGTAVKGNLTFSWSFPLKGNLRGYMQASHGYGESLIDYNHRQTTAGVGLSLIEWL